MRIRPIKTCALLTAALTIAGASSAGAQTLTRGVVDNDAWWWNIGSASQNTWLNRTAATGAKIVQIEVDWGSITQYQPSGNAADPANAAYATGFATTDQKIKAVEAKGLTPEILVDDPPYWAQSAGGTSAEYATGVYEPSATYFGAFAQALATRYSGHYDGLPRVKYFEALGEQNLSAHLVPQWTQVNGVWQNTGASYYRTMLNAFYAGVKNGNGTDTVVLGGLSPYGDYTLRNAILHGISVRTPPVTFLENLLCLNSKLQRTCSAQTKFDVLASDPYQAPGNSPDLLADFPTDTGSSDLGKLVKVERAAVKAGTLAGGMKPLWVAEFGFDTNPPSPFTGVSPILQARWEEWSLQIFASEGVSVALTHLIRDEKSVVPARDDQFLNESGLYYYNGSPKPSLTAFEFPFVLTRTSKKTQAWGISPQNGTITVQRLVGSSWRTVKRFGGRTNQIYNVSLGKQPHATFRAKIGNRTSITWGT